MSQLSDASASESRTAIHWLAVLLVVATGAIHVYAGLVEGRIPVLLAGVGFFGGIGLFLVDFRRPLLYLAGVVYTAVQFPLWYVAKAGEFTAIGYVDKAVQVVLVVTLLYLYWRRRTTTGRGRGSPNV
ncbi:DUF7475 family protein [Halobacterium bonnevillei]|uniref:Uncharacterized protein n=1 Tax=Halobacterium bonnevillei TaxID=2692200 RepID=A0A6B0STL6_9EURY|nr:hypothetical protein [Halobacterium bonnevillei]MXR20919.1 hypothetical protein [Halobacterium bonnevillei]